MTEEADEAVARAVELSLALDALRNAEAQRKKLKLQRSAQWWHLVHIERQSPSTVVKQMRQALLDQGHSLAEAKQIVPEHDTIERTVGTWGNPKPRPQV